MTDPIRNPGAYDRIKIAGVDSPWLVEVTGGSYKFKFDTVQATATLGASSTPIAEEITEFQIQFFLCKKEHFDAWPPMRDLLKTPPKKKQTKALQIEYPSLNEIGINAASCVELQQMMPVGDEGLFSYIAKMSKYAPPKKAPATIKGTDADKSKTNEKKQTQEDEYDRMIRDLTTQVQTEANK